MQNYFLVIAVDKRGDQWQITAKCEGDPSQAEQLFFVVNKEKPNENLQWILGYRVWTDSKHLGVGTQPFAELIGGNGVELFYGWEYAIDIGLASLIKQPSE